jgi:recombination protein RecA
MARKNTPPPPPNDLDASRQAALDRALGDITKRYGDGTIMRLGEAQHMNVEIIPTGSLSLDIALGVGGIPRGRITEIFGPESSGKTTICQHIVAEAQHLGGTCAFIDMEHALDPSYAARCGVDIEPADFPTGRWRTGIRNHPKPWFVPGRRHRSNRLVAALVPRAEIEGVIWAIHQWACRPG